jgi:hypothetical protein
MTHTPLNLFLSYASEDQAIADALAKCLKASFSDDKVDVQMMTRFPIGADWRKAIDEGVDGADVLIAISSARSKAGHSYTGYEVGAFAFSCRQRPQMANHPNVVRKTIPFTMLSGVPDTMHAFQGVTFDPRMAFDVQYDANRIDSELSDLRSDGAGVYSDKIFGLLKEIYDLTRQAEGHATAHAMDQKLQLLKAEAQSLSKGISELLLARERYSARPKSKVIVRIEPQHRRAGVTDAHIRIEGPCSNAFGIGTSPTRSMRWRDFTAHVDSEDISAGWRSTFDELIREAGDGRFPDKRLTSYDRKKTFRVFISKVIEFYSGAHEYHIYVVELMREKEYGDSTTNLLQNALRVGLAYRSMFLEETSEFGPDLMKATEPAEFRKEVNRLTTELEYLLQLARETGLYEARSTHAILGKNANMDERYALWDQERGDLMEIAHRVVTQKGEPIDLKRKFISQLTLFRGNTRRLNEEYLSAVLEKLQLKVGLNMQSEALKGLPLVKDRGLPADGRMRQPENSSIPPRRRAARSPDGVLVPVRSRPSVRGATDNSTISADIANGRQTK